jgi:translation initiation factor IF-1
MHFNYLAVQNVFAHISLKRISAYISLPRRFSLYRNYPVFGFEHKSQCVDSKLILNILKSGRIRKNFINILPGDRVTIEMSKYDLTKGRITYRTKG